MKKILCLGDSNTYGFNPENFSRYKKEERWSGILSLQLKNAKVIEEGKNNRTCFSNQEPDDLCAINIIEKYLDKSYTDIIFALGINDLQTRFKMNEEKFEAGLKKTIEKIYSINSDVKILILIPSEINESILKSYFNTLFDKNSCELSKKIENIYLKISQEYNCNDIKLKDICSVSDIDSLHYDINNHKLIAKELLNY